MRTRELCKADDLLCVKKPCSQSRLWSWPVSHDLLILGGFVRRHNVQSERLRLTLSEVEPGQYTRL